MLLDLAGVIFQEQSTLELMIHRILTHMMCLIQVNSCSSPSPPPQCERAMVLLVHEGSQSNFDRVYELDRHDLDDEGMPKNKPTDGGW